ncbi:MAG TPA: ABC transporter [Candidatus Latescibacteria bacterium]|nr:ABC transporter [Candidatus Latescibacterota bacterium]
MNSISAEIRASIAFIERNFNLAKRYASWEVIFTFWNVVHALTIGLIGVYMGGDDPVKVRESVLFLVVGAVLWNFLRLLFYEVADAVAWERWEGTIEYTFMAPVYRLTHLAGQCVYAIIYGFLRSGIVLISAVFFFDLDLVQANLTAAFLVLAAASLSFLGMGLMAAVFPLLSPEKGARATDIFGTLVLLISGVYYDISVLPDWLRPLSTFSPGTYALRSIRAALLRNASLGDVQFDLILLVIIGIVLIPLGLWIFHLAEVYAKKTGRLKRSG